MKHRDASIYLHQMNYYKKHVISLCIPRVAPNTTQDLIRNTINNLALGDIDHIDMVSIKQNEQPYKKVYIHFSSWSSSERTSQIYKTLHDGNPIKVFHEDPWFWKICLARV
jgi:hypothetical protein